MRILILSFWISFSAFAALDGATDKQIGLHHPAVKFGRPFMSRSRASFCVRPAEESVRGLGPEEALLERVVPQYGYIHGDNGFQFEDPQMMEEDSRLHQVVSSVARGETLLRSAKVLRHLLSKNRIPIDRWNEVMFEVKNFKAGSEPVWNDVRISILRKRLMGTPDFEKHCAEWEKIRARPLCAVE